MRSASSNSDGLEEMGDIAGVNDEGWLDRSALILFSASSSVPRAFGFAGLSNPTWLSLICRRSTHSVVTALASPIMPIELGTPPATVHRTPVPAPGHAFENFAPADAALVAVIRSHRQSPLKPESLARIRSGISKIYSLVSRRRFFRTCNDRLTWSFNPLLLRLRQPP